MGQWFEGNKRRNKGVGGREGPRLGESRATTCKSNTLIEYI